MSRQEADRIIRLEIKRANDGLRIDSRRVIRITDNSNKNKFNMEHKFKVIWTQMDGYILETSIQKYLDKVYNG